MRQHEPLDMAMAPVAHTTDMALAAEKTVIPDAVHLVARHKKSRWKAAFLQRKPVYSTVTDLARLRGLSTSVPRATAVW